MQNLSHQNSSVNVPIVMEDFFTDQFSPYPTNASYAFGAFDDFDVNKSKDNCSVMFYEDMKKYFSSNQIDIPIIYCLIALIGLLGNGLVMFVIIGSREITKTVTNIYILNLAIADTMFLMTLPLVASQRFLLAWPFGVTICKISEAIKHLNIFASVYFLTAMSVDRYIAVVYVVVSNRYRTIKNTFFACTAIWASSIAMVIPLLIFTDVKGGLCRLMFNSDELFPSFDGEIDEGIEDYFSGQDYKDLCNYYSGLSGPAYPFKDDGSGDYFDYDLIESNSEALCKHPESKQFHIFILISFVLGFLGPFCVITVCYLLIIARLAQSSESAGSRSKQAERTRRKVTRMVVTLVLTFFICWLPFHLVHILQIPGINVGKDACRIMKDFTFCLGFANSCLNPILYTFLGHNFQERLKKSITISLRSFSVTKFTKYSTNNNTSRAETAGLTKKEGAHSENPTNTSKFHNQHVLTQLPEEERCLSSSHDYNASETV